MRRHHIAKDIDEYLCKRRQDCELAYNKRRKFFHDLRERLSQVIHDEQQKQMDQAMNDDNGVLIISHEESFFRLWHGRVRCLFGKKKKKKIPTRH